MRTAKNTPKQHCPEKPTQSQTSPPSRLSQLLSIFTSHSLPNTPFPSSLTLLLQTCAHPQECNQPYNHSRTNLCCGYFSHGAAGRGPGSARLAPFTVAIPAFPPASPAPTPHSARITPPNTHRDRKNWLNTLTTLPHYASKRKNRGRQKTSREGDWLWLQKTKTGWIWGKDSWKGFFLQLGWDMGVISFVRLCFRGYRKPQCKLYSTAQPKWNTLVSFCCH